MSATIQLARIALYCDFSKSETGEIPYARDVWEFILFAKNLCLNANEPSLLSSHHATKSEDGGFRNFEKFGEELKPDEVDKHSTMPPLSDDEEQDQDDETFIVEFWTLLNGHLGKGSLISKSQTVKHDLCTYLRLRFNISE